MTILKFFRFEAESTLTNMPVILSKISGNRALMAVLKTRFGKVLLLHKYLFATYLRKRHWL